MAVLKCKMCGAALTVGDNDKFAQCRYCDSMQTLPNLDNELKMKLFERATELRLACDFDQAAGVFQSIIAQFPDEAEAYWGLVLCKYGIEYVDDPRDSKKVPTCHRTRPQSVLNDPDFLAACDRADLAKWKYEEEAQVIDGLQQKILSISRGEEPYDVFICYKETDDTTRLRTEDSMTAQDIYTELIAKGYKVFFSRVTLRGKAGSEYEPYIYAALSSAKVMLVLGSKQDYFNAVWLKNEWSRYLEMMKDGDKVLIPCYDSITPEQLPRQLQGFQALNVRSITFLSDLRDNIERVVGGKTTTAPVMQVVEQPIAQTAIDTTPLLRRAELFLEDGNWNSVDEYCEKALDIDPECAKAYVYKLLAKYRKNKANQLDFDFETDILFKKAIRFADATLKAELETTLANGKEAARKKAEHEAFLEAQRQAREKARMEEEARQAREKARREAELAERKAREEAERQQKQLRLQQRRKLCSQMIAAGYEHVVALKPDGTVVAVGSNSNGQCDVSSWKHIVAVAAGSYHTVGLRADGTVVAVGNTHSKRCNVADWKDIIAIAAGESHTVGLKTDGTVVAVGSNFFKQCDVSEWNNIVGITTGHNHTVGLKANGTVVAVGCDMRAQLNVSSWGNIVAIAAGNDHTVGLKADGTVVAVGIKDAFGTLRRECKVADWRNIVAIAAGYNYTVGLKADGTVVAVGYDQYVSCDVTMLNDIEAITAGQWHTVGLKTNGMLQIMHLARKKQANVETIRMFDDILTVQDVMEQTKRDGVNQLQREKERKQLYAARRTKGVCQHCGGELKGLFTKKCASCGKPKDY